MVAGQKKIDGQLAAGRQLFRLTAGQTGHLAGGQLLVGGPSSLSVSQSGKFLVFCYLLI
jgi:hypothetical protein